MPGPRLSPPPPPSPPPLPCAGAAASGRGGDDDGDGDTALPPRPGLTSSVTRGCSLPRSWAQGRRWRLWSWPRTSSGRLCGSASPALAWNSSCTFAIFLPPPARPGSAQPGPSARLRPGSGSGSAGRAPRRSGRPPAAAPGTAGGQGAGPGGAPGPGCGWRGPGRAGRALPAPSETALGPVLRPPHSPGALGSAARSRRDPPHNARELPARKSAWCQAFCV